MTAKRKPREKHDLSTITARRQLKARARYAVRVRRGCTLQYRKGDPGDAGKWHVKVRDADAGTASGYRFALLGEADDLGEGTGLSYEDAFTRARKWRPDRDGASAGRGGGPLTVADAVERYLAWSKSHRKSDPSGTFDTHVLKSLGTVRVSSLTAEQLRKWHQELADKPVLLRPRRDGKRKTRPAVTEDQKRARRATANRVMGTLKAALNRAWKDGLVESRDAWERVEPFRAAGAARVGYLERDELARLLNGCEPAFRRLVLAAIYTGCRYAELCRLTAGDWRPEAGPNGAVHVRTSKSGAARFVFLGPEGRAFFDAVAAGKPPRELLLTKDGGSPWRKSEQARPMAAAVESAKLPRVTFHQLRHTYASLYLMAGGSLVALAKQLGHTTTRMVETHYGHLSDAWRANEAAQHAPALGFDPAARGATPIRSGRRGGVAVGRG